MATKKKPVRRWNQEPKDDTKVEIPEFNGKTQGDELLEWYLTIERVFDLKEYTEERKVKVVAIELKGYASLWWENLKRDREHVGKVKIITWVR